MPLSSGPRWGIHHGYVSVNECWNRQTAWGETERTNVLYDMKLTAGLSWNILYRSACYHDSLLTHLCSTAMRPVCGGSPAPYHTASSHTWQVRVWVCVCAHSPVCMLSSSRHCGSHFALSMVSPTVVVLLHSAHRHRHTLSPSHTLTSH